MEKQDKMVGGACIIYLVLLVILLTVLLKPVNGQVQIEENIEISLDTVTPLLHWADDIMNSDNEEFLIEVIFNNPDAVTNHELQILFVERYWNTCKPETKEWYKVYIEHIKTSGL